MLVSLWDYLRRRTAESVLLGIQDALAAAERPATEVAAGELVVQLELRGDAPGGPAAPESSQLQLANPQSPPPQTPPPRRRGRPRLHGTTP